MEHVVLVDKHNTPIGTMPKSEVHGKTTPLHRAFSCFIFRRSDNKFLIQQRSLTKVTWPGVWSNSVCGHPLPDESTETAVRRRLEFELGITEAEIREVLPDFRYRASRDGIEENEICPVWVGFTDQDPTPNSDEVEAVEWIDWEDFVTRLQDLNDNTYDHFSVWCREEAVLLAERGMV